MSDRENKTRDERRTTLEVGEGATDPGIPLPQEAGKPRGLVHSCMAWAVGAEEEGETDDTLVARQLQRRFALLAVVLAAWLVAYVRWIDDPLDLLYSTRHGAMAVLAVVSAGWVFLLLPTVILATTWLVAYVHDHPDLPPKHATYDPTPFFRSALTVSNRLVMQLCAALTCVFVVVTFFSNFLFCVALLSVYLIVVPKLLQFGLFRLARVRLQGWAHAPIGLGELVYLQHVFFPLVTAAGFAVLYLQSAETLGLRELTWCVLVLVVAHWGFAALWFRLSLRRRDAMKPAERERRAMFRRKVAERARWEGPVILVGLAIFAVLPFLSTAQAASAAKEALADRRRWEDPELACPTIDDLAKAEVAIFLVSDNQFRALDGHTIAHSPQIAELVSVAVRPVELDLLSVAAFDHFARMYRELAAHKRAKAWDQLDVRWAHLGDFGDLACHSELARLEGRIPCFGEDSFAGIVPGNHDAYFTGNFGWHPDWSRDAACKDSDPMSRSEAPTVSSVFADAVGGSSKVLGHTDPGEHSFFTSIADLGSVGERPVVGVFFDTSDFAGSSAGAAGVQGEITSGQKGWVIDALDRIGGEPLVIFFMHHPYADLSTMARWRVEDVEEVLGPRLIAIVSGHTHQSQHRRPKLNGREVHEFIVGSTTDPPQEAALLALGVDAGNLLVLAFQTVPSVARSGDDNGVESAILAEECEQVVAALKDVCECRPLFGLEPTLDECVTTPRDPAEPDDPLRRSRLEMENRARALFDCTERIAGPYRNTARWTDRFENPPTDDADPYRAFQDECASDELLSEERHKELVCLSWIASTLQGRDKSEGWTFAEASEIAFERLAANEAWGVKVRIALPSTPTPASIRNAGLQ